MKGFSRGMIRAGVFCALIAVCSQIALPLPAGIPITLQTLVVALCGYSLGWKWASASVAVYLLLGGIGLPLFSGFAGGFGWLFGGPTAGFLWGFLMVAFCCGLPLKNRLLSVLCGIGGMLVCHLLGVVWYGHFTAQGFWQSFLVISFPYLLKDVLCIALAEWLANKLRFFKKRY